jgi:aspartate ammonia-lyase
MTDDDLRDLPFFKGMPDTLLWHMGRAAEKRTLKPDDELFREGEERRLLAVIVNGELSIERKQGKSSARITTLGTGEVVGEAILLEEPNHGTSGRATRQTELVVFSKDTLMKLLKDQPALYAALLSRAAKIINERIKRANAVILAERSAAESKG